MLHNRYQVRGGEDESTDNEVALLRKKGHEVTLLEENNHSIIGLRSRLTAAASSVWSRDWYDRVKATLSAERFDVMHVQNFFPLISPSVYYAARSRGVPVVQAIRNYRLACPSANLFRDGAYCEDCLGKSFKYPGIINKCYRDSASASATVASMLQVHRSTGTWEIPSRYIAISEFVRAKLVQDGYPAQRIVVKPNFVGGQEHPPPVSASERRHFLYVGRFSPEKGIDDLIEAYGSASTTANLLLVGDAGAEVKKYQQPGVASLGKRPLSEVYELMRNAIAVIMPGRWPEPFGRVAIEAFAAGTPVISTGTGGPAEIIEHGSTGFLTKSACPGELSENLRFLDLNRQVATDMGRAAQKKFLELYSEDANYKRLIEIYHDAKTTLPH